MGTSICGRILRVNLSNGTVSHEELGEKFYRTYFGGSGFTAYFLLNETPAGADPLGPENVLVFSSGPLTGLPFPGSARHGVGAKSPLTNGFGDAQAGGFWGTELKRSGLDAVIIEGQSEKPVYIAIQDGVAEIRDGSGLWGLPGKACIDRIHEDLGGDRFRVAYIGPGGENLVRYACIGHDLRAFAGRCGLGAVMGSKHLKAMAVRGSRVVEASDMPRIRELTQWLVKNRLPYGAAKALNTYGTLWLLPGLSQAGGFPTRNFREGHLESVGRIGPTAVHDTIVAGKEGCYACPIRCKRVVRVKDPYEIDERYGAPEYETLAALGSCCGVDDIFVIARANQLCTDYGLDTISTGVTIAFAMECYEAGILDRGDTEGLELTFGNGQAVLELIEQIAHKRGLGAVLAEGCKRASEIIGRGAEEYAVHVKGQEVPMHEPRLKHAMGVGYAVSPTGADHCHNVHDTKLTTEDGIADWKALGILEPVQLRDLGPDKMRLTTYVINWEHFINSAVACRLVPWDVPSFTELVRSATGWNTSAFELAKLGERVGTMARVYNLREGLTRRDDSLPARLMEPFASGPLAGVSIDASSFNQAVGHFYKAMGWTEDGVPTTFKLHELAIPWAKDELPRE